MQALWEGIQPIIDYIGTMVLGALESWKENFNLLADTFRARSPQIQQVFSNAAQAVTGAWECIQPVLSMLREEFDITFSFIGQMAKEGCGVVIDALAGITSFLASAFAGDWDTAWQTLKTTLRDALRADDVLSRKRLLTEAQAQVAALHNESGLTAPLPAEIVPYFRKEILVIWAERYAEALQETLRGTELEHTPLMGTLSQVANLSTISDDPAHYRRIRKLYE